MDDRIRQEIELLKKEYPNLEWKTKDEIVWIRIPEYRILKNLWNKDSVSVCFQIPPGYPGNAPYGFHVEDGLRVKETDQKPDNYEEPAPTPFDGAWGKFSWTHDNSWRATTDLNTGANLLNFVRSFQERLKDGK